MVAGHLREKSGYYYAVLNYTDSLGKRKTKWISTGLTVKGNKKRAEAILMDARRNFNPEEPKVMNGDILFADYMEKWLDIIKNSVAVPTFASYSTTVKKIVAPYFREKEVTLKNLTAKDIQEFYLSELERVSPSSVIHYHANIHKALKYAVKIGDLIKPHYVTESFPKLLKAKGMRQIRYHDLRHSCASLLLANGVPMKQIQEWLGHSDFSTTANIYAHLDYSSKLTSADAMLNGLGFAQN